MRFSPRPLLYAVLFSRFSISSPLLFLFNFYVWVFVPELGEMGKGRGKGGDDDDAFGMGVCCCLGLTAIVIGLIAGACPDLLLMRVYCDTATPSLLMWCPRGTVCSFFTPRPLFSLASLLPPLRQGASNT